MSKFFKTIVEALELQARVLADTEPTEKIDALYIYGETEDNQPSSFTVAAELAIKAGLIAYLRTGTLITGRKFVSDYDDKLVKLGVPKEKIIFTDLPTGLAHTHTEAIALVELAKKMNWQTIYILAPPLHLLRAFVETVTAILNIYPELKVFGKMGKPLAWTETIIHSQDILTGRRCDLVQSETEKLEQYYDQGGLLNARQVLDYLNLRDQDT